MSEEGALALALAATLPIPESPWHNQPRMSAWAQAAISFARKSSHADGSCDDYYPYERAYGAAVFSLHALAHAAELVGCSVEDREFLERRARWIAKHDESGTLANHHAIAAAALAATAALCNSAELHAAAQRKVDEVLALQHAEGWFTEYDGCDPGYTTVTVDHLARCWQRSGDARVLAALERACNFLESVQHPDGTFGGEYGARNTHHVVTHGFELLAPRIPAARRIADRVLQALDAGLVPTNDDDRLVFHTLAPLLWSWRDFHERTPRVEPFPVARTHLSDAGFIVWRTGTRTLVAGLRKGGPFRVYEGTTLRHNDSGVTLVQEDGTVLVSSLRHDAAIRADADTAECSTQFAAARREKLTPMKSVVLRAFMLGPGRFCRGLVRRLLQRRVVSAHGTSAFRLRRTFRVEGAGFVVRDEISAVADAPAVKSAWCSVGQTSHYTAAAQPWSPAWLLPWTELHGAPAELAAGKTFVFERSC